MGANSWLSGGRALTESATLRTSYQRRSWLSAYPQSASLPFSEDLFHIKDDQTNLQKKTGAIPNQ